MRKQIPLFIAALTLLCSVVGVGTAKEVVSERISGMDKAECEGLLRLNKAYVLELEKLLPKMTERTDLDGANAVKEEIDKVKQRMDLLSENTVPAEPGKLESGPKELLAVQETFLERRKTSLKKFFELYLEDWEQLRDAYTREAALEDANAMQAAINEIEERLALLLPEDEGGQAMNAERPKRAPPEAVNFGTSYYLFVSGQASFQQAIDWCESHGGNLVIIETEEEDHFVGKLSGYVAVLIGAQWDTKREEYRWMDRSKIEYKNFGDVDELFGKDQSCLMKNRYRGGPGGGSWYSAHPDAVTGRGFVCEWD